MSSSGYNNFKRSKLGLPLNLGPCDHCGRTMFSPVALVHVKDKKNLIVHAECKITLAVRGGQK